MKPEVKYTQQVDEKTGKITFVPDTPSQDGNGGNGGQGQGQSQQSQGDPQQGKDQNQNGDPQDGGDHTKGKPTEESDHQQRPGHKKSHVGLKANICDGTVVFPRHYLDLIQQERDEVADDYLDYSENHKLTELLNGLEANNKKLRYAKRLQGGKLDGRRLTAYRTSDRLFKKKAIKHKDYQFNILIDTSGSMFHSEILTAMSAVAKTVKAIEAIGMPVAVWSMNVALGLVKDYDESFNDDVFTQNMLIMSAGVVIDRERNLQIMSEDELNKELHRISTDGDYSIDQSNLRVAGQFAGGTNENVAYEQSLAHSKAHSTPKTKPVFIVLSDGEPGGGLNQVPVLKGDKIEYVEPPETGNDVSSLHKWWVQRETELTAYGIGIYSRCGQVPNSQTINDLDQLPEVMSDLVQQIIF